MRRRARFSLGLPALSLGLLPAAAQPVAKGAGAGGSIREGGTFRIVFPATEFDSLDPALSYTVPSGVLLETTCARLMTLSDESRPVPEVAAARPRISRDDKTHTFTLRSGFRFNDGTPVRASAFARAIERTLAPGVQSPGAQYTSDTARGDRLVVRFTRPTPDFTAQTTMSFFCAVPPTLPADPEGVGAFPAAGPYYVAEYRPGRRVVVERNRFYRGKRPHHVGRFVVDLGADSQPEVLDRIERNEADWGWVPPPVYFDRVRRLVAKYGVNKSQFFVTPGLALRSYALNTSRPIPRPWLLPPGSIRPLWWPRHRACPSTG